MSARDAATCPACGDKVLPVEGRAFALECERCRGRWLDRSATEEVVRGVITLADEAEKIETKGDRAQTPYRGAPRLGVADRDCPFCAARLRPVRVEAAGIDLDVCPSHGTWFDAGELEAVVGHYREKVAKRDESQAMDLLIERARRPSARARRWHPFW